MHPPRLLWSITMPAKVGLKRHGKGRAKLGSKKRKSRNKKK